MSESLQASRIQLAARPGDHRQWRRLIAGLDSIVRLPPPEASAFAEAPARQAQSGSLERRVGVIRSRLKRERIVRYQRSLFDRRADAGAASRQAVADRLDAGLCRTLRSVTSPIALDATRVELVAAWPERRR